MLHGERISHAHGVHPPTTHSPIRAKSSVAVPVGSDSRKFPTEPIWALESCCSGFPICVTSHFPSHFPQKYCLKYTPHSLLSVAMNGERTGTATIALSLPSKRCRSAIYPQLSSWVDPDSAPWEPSSRSFSRDRDEREREEELTFAGAGQMQTRAPHHQSSCVRCTFE